MATPVIITNVYEVELQWSNLAGVAPRNVFHMLHTGTLDALAANLEAGLTSDMFAAMPSAYNLDAFGLRKLDGISGQTTHEISGVSGTGEADMGPALCALLSLHTGLSGGSHRGRMYIGPVAESVQNSGQLDDAVRVTMNGAWGSFITDGSSDDPPFTLVIASKKFETAAPVINWHVEAVLATQRRRQNQLR